MHVLASDPEADAALPELVIHDRDVLAALQRYQLVFKYHLTSVIFLVSAHFCIPTEMSRKNAAIRSSLLECFRFQTFDT